LFVNELTVRNLDELDYEKYLVHWWKDWKWVAPVKDFLPDSGKGGVMVLDNDTPVCAGYIYMTNSKVAWVDWIISNREYKNRAKRKQALTLLIETLTKMCKDLGFIFSYALIKNNSLMKTYKELGYTEADSYNKEMIKKL
tara:strand:+ start:217 stop:636 length:420 start_codon:yes stop_codon:yes gene_type:complete